MPAWSTWDSLWPRDSCLSPKFFSFIIYQCTVVELLMCKLSIWQHHKNLTLKPIRHWGYFNGYVPVYEPRYSQISLCCPYAAHHIDAVCLKLFSLFGYVCSWEIFLQMAGLSFTEMWCHVISSVSISVGKEHAVLSVVLSTVSINFNCHSCAKISIGIPSKIFLPVKWIYKKETFRAVRIGLLNEMYKS